MYDVSCNERCVWGFLKDTSKTSMNAVIIRELLTKFTTNEIMNWKEMCTEYESELRNGPANSTAATVFTSKTEDGNKRWKDLKIRVVEHVSKL